MEFRRQFNNHSAVHCKLKKRLTGDWGDIRDRSELPCHSYNAGRCFLPSGHPIKNQGHTSSGLVKMLHICTFCFEYRGENNAHNDRECRLKKKLMYEVENERHYEKSIEHVPGKKKERADEPLKSKRKQERREVENENERFTSKSDQHKKGVCETNKKKRKEKEDKSPTKKGERDILETIKDKKEMSLEGNQRKNVGEENNETEFFNSKLFMQVKEANDTKVKASAVTKNPFRVCLIKNNNGNSVQNSINKSESNVNEITKNENQFNEKKYSNMEGIVSLDMNPVDQCIGLSTNAVQMAFNNKCSTPKKKEEQENGTEQIKNLPALKTSKNNNLNDQHLSAKVSHVKKRRKLERFNPHAIIHLNDAKNPNPHASILENENIGMKQVLLDNCQGEEIDPNTEIEEDKIMKKIEILEKLHAIEIEKLRKAQEQIQVPNNSLD